MPEIALRLPIAYFPEQISGSALHPDVMRRHDARRGAQYDFQSESWPRF